MQAQQSQQLAVTAKQSLQVVQTLLRASFGCLAYLRDLLPDDNFTDGYFTASGEDSFSQSDAHTASGQPRDRIPSRALPVKLIKKDFSTEGDSLIQYLEEGIFDALEKQYLRSFIFAVYLDDKDPENIVEAYTFNFSYHAVSGSTFKVPIMTLGERLEKMSLDTGSTSKVDPASDAIMNGKPPTLGDVKKSVKNLMKKIMTSMQFLPALPKRRFGTFKLFYLDHVPEDYEPPHFTPGDANNKYYFTTHAVNEIPAKTSFASLGTPHHCVELHLASIVDVIPQAGESPEDAAHFGELLRHDAGSYPAIQNPTLAERENLIDAQRQDALLRKVVWDAEAFANPEGEHDAEGEYDPDYQGPWDNILSQQPKGIRCTDGTIVTINRANADETMVLQGLSGEKIDELDSVKITKLKPIQEEMSPTQVLEPTQHAFPNQEESGMSRGVDTQLIRQIIERRDAADSDNLGYNIQDSEMLDLETQLPTENPTHSADVPIITHRSQDQSSSEQVMDISQKTSIRPKNGAGRNDSNQELEVTECDCGILEDEDYGACQCEGRCGRWLHIWCMGYHSVDDPRLPPVFHCFTCRLRNDPQIDMLDSRGLTSEYISKFKDLSFFRRALKIIEVHRPENVTRFKELLGSEVSMAGQAWKRLEAEGFITIRTTETDEIGLLETQATSSRKGKGKARGKQRARKNIKRAKYIPVAEMMTGKAFRNYFEPMKEASLLGITKPRTTTMSSARSQEATFKVPEKAFELQMQPPVHPDPESQTQSDTQFSTQAAPKRQAPLEPSSSKRKSADEDVSENTNRKRMKISVGFGINLED